MTVERIGDATLYLGDCLEILPTIGPVDAVVTDPPYGISRECNLTADGVKGYGSVDFGAWDSEFPYPVLPMLAEKKAGTYYFFCPYQALGKLSEWARANRFQERVLWWKKTNPTRRNGDVYWSIPGEHCFFAKRSGAPFNAKYDVGFFEYGNVQGQEHPTVKPLGLISKLCEASSLPGAIILDPFMGSGTTGVACANLGRKFIGIEIEPKYFDIACRRIRDAYAQPRLPLEEETVTQGELL